MFSKEAIEQRRAYLEQADVVARELGKLTSVSVRTLGHLAEVGYSDERAQVVAARPARTRPPARHPANRTRRQGGFPLNDANVHRDGLRRSGSLVRAEREYVWAPRASLTLPPAGSLSRPRRPLSRGSGPSGHPAEPLVSYQINRQFSSIFLHR
jgi:hypothetical protein